MKICLVTPEFRPTWGGVGSYTYHLAKELRDQAEIHVLTAWDGKKAMVVPEGVILHALPNTRESMDGGSPFKFQLGVRRHLPRLMHAYDYDIIHANHAYMSDLLVRPMINAANRVVTVHTTLDTQTQGTARAGRNVPTQPVEARVARWKPILARVERYYLKRSPSMIFVSRWVQSQAVEKYGLDPRHTAIVHNGVDIERFAPNGENGDARHQDDRGPTILFAGRLLAMKGLGTLLLAMQNLDPKVRLLVAGPGQRRAWMALTQYLKLKDRVRFLGPVPYDLMPYLYRRVDAVVLPSFVESCPMVALEAMATGTPLIASDVGGIREIVHEGETGWLFPPGDIQKLSTEIIHVLNRKREVRRVAEQARFWMEHHGTVQQMADWTLRFYEEDLAGVAA